MVTKGKIVAVDTTVIESVRYQPKEKRKEKNTQDPKADYNVKVGGNPKVTYSYKLHAKTDTDGFIRKLT